MKIQVKFLTVFMFSNKLIVVSRSRPQKYRKQFAPIFISEVSFGY